MPQPSPHYLDEHGQAYFAWQNQGGLQRGQIYASKYARFIHPIDTVLDFGCGGGCFLEN